MIEFTIVVECTLDAFCGETLNVDFRHHETICAHSVQDEDAR